MSTAEWALAVMGGVTATLALVVIGIAVWSCWKERHNADAWAKRQTIGKGRT